MKIATIMIQQYDQRGHHTAFDSMLHKQMNDNLTILHNADHQTEYSTSQSINQSMNQLPIYDGKYWLPV